MPNPMMAMVGVGAGTQLVGASMQSKAADRAAGAQVEAAEMGIEEQRRQFDTVRELLQPFVTGGTDAMKSMAIMAGLGDPGDMEGVIESIQQGPEFAELFQQGEEAILSQASATGGLRGGNVQGALAQFRPQVLSDLLGQRYQRLGGLAGMGQASAAGVGSAAQTTGSNVSNLMQQIGAAQAGGALARGNAFGQALGGIGQGAGFLAGNVAMPEGASIFGQWGF